MEILLLPSSLIWEEGFVSEYEAAYRIDTRPLQESTCTLLVWTKDLSQTSQLLIKCAKRAKKLGFRKLETNVSTNIIDRIDEIPFSIKDSKIIIGKSYCANNNEN
ncbi:MAG: hypothetical protein ACE5KD_02525 [Candidatus Bathyarchaeia archaeon]